MGPWLKKIAAVSICSTYYIVQLARKSVSIICSVDMSKAKTPLLHSKEWRHFRPVHFRSTVLLVLSASGRVWSLPFFSREPNIIR